LTNVRLLPESDAMEAAEEALIKDLVEMMAASCDTPGEIGKLDVLDNLASIGARVLSTREVDDDFDTPAALADALNELPEDALEDDVRVAVTNAGYVIRRAGLTLVNDSFGDAQPEYFQQFE
jgi:hypothetical protein